MPFGRGALHLFANWNPSSPNLLDEPLKDFIVIPACSPWKCFGSYKPRRMGNHDCNTSGVLNTKICHVIICIAHHPCVSENFDMHSLKQVYFYVMC